VAELIRLQQIDEEIYRIRRRLTDGPALVARREEKLRRENAAVEAEKVRIRDRRKDIHQRELDLKVKETEILKLTTQQNQSRTNQEYRALGEHVQRLQEECSVLEDRILEGFSQLEELEAELKKLDAASHALQRELDEARLQWQKDELAYREELRQREERRAQFCKELPSGPLTIYERALKARAGVAVVRVEGRVCSGCRMALTPNDLTRLRGPNEIVLCKTCDRILYLPE